MHATAPSQINNFIYIIYICILYIILCTLYTILYIKIIHIIYLYMNIWYVYMYIYVCMGLCMYLYMYVYVYIYIYIYDHWIPFRRFNRLSYHAMSSTRTKSQLSTATPIPSLVQCRILFRLLSSSVATFILIKILLR